MQRKVMNGKSYWPNTPSNTQIATRRSQLGSAWSKENGISLCTSTTRIGSD